LLPEIANETSCFSSNRYELVILVRHPFDRPVSMRLDQTNVWVFVSQARRISMSEMKPSRRQLLTMGLKALAVAVPVAVVVSGKPAKAAPGPVEFRRRWRRRW
jgi:hypothetical protein